MSSTTVTKYSPKTTHKDDNANHTSTTKDKASTTTKRRDEITPKPTFDSSCTVGITRRSREKSGIRNEEGYCNAEDSTESKTCTLATSMHLIFINFNIRV